MSLKWPNDVQVGGRKLAGVLSEALWQGDALTGAVLGMGLNVRVDFRGSPLEGKRHQPGGGLWRRAGSRAAAGPLAGAAGPLDAATR